MNSFSATLLNNATGTSAAASWPGGKGNFAVKATGYGTVDLQFQLPDNATWVTPSGASLAADGGITFELGPCLIRAVAVTATAVYATAFRITE